MDSIDQASIAIRIDLVGVYLYQVGKDNKKAALYWNSSTLIAFT